MDSPDIHILAAGTALPGPAIDNAAPARRFNLNPAFRQWVETFTGTKIRHLAVDLEIVDLETGEVRSVGVAIESSKWIKAGFAPERV